MKKTILSLIGGLAVAFSMAAAAAQSTVAITTGANGGSYAAFGDNLAKVLSERGFSITTMNSAGSVENLERVASGKAQIGFAQADALAATGAPVEILGSLGQECMFVAAGPNIGDEDDLAGKSIAVGEQGSGSAVSWDYARQLESDYLDTSTHYTGGVLALAKVKTGQLDAFLWVTSPGNFDHKFLRAVRQEGSGLHIIGMNDYDMNDALPNGQSVYEFQDVDLEADGWGSEDSIETACTQVLVVANPDMDGAALEAAATEIMMNSNRIQGI